MLNNRKVYLYMVHQANRPLSQGKIQLLMCMCMRQSHTKHYQFIPTEEGPLSLVLESDTLAMLKRKLLAQDDSSEQLLSINADQYEMKMMPKDEDKHLVDATLGEYLEKSEQDLIAIATTMNPFYAIYLPKEKLDMLNSKSRSEIAKIRETIRNSRRALYTIGYEKISLDEFIQILLLHDIQSVIDVRETTISRRREFSKKPLEEGLNRAKIGYLSIPEVGIPSVVRNEILKDGIHQDLLIWYKENVLPKSKEYTKLANSFLQKGNTALMCYEKDPKECHRSLFAQSCKEHHPEIPEIIHLRDSDEPSLITLFY